MRNRFSEWLSLAEANTDVQTKLVNHLRPASSTPVGAKTSTPGLPVANNSDPQLSVTKTWGGAQQGGQGGSGLPKHTNPQMQEAAEMVYRVRKDLEKAAAIVNKSGYYQQYSDFYQSYLTRLREASVALGQLHAIMSGDSAWKTDEA